MKLTLDDAVLSRLSHWTTADVVLDYDQTIGETGRPVDGCAIGTRFRLIAIDKGTLPPQFDVVIRSEEHTSELQSLRQISYAVFCLKKLQTVSAESLKRNKF